MPSRRDFLGSLALLGLSPYAAAQTKPTGRLPARGEFVIRNAYVMTMESGAGDLTDADVHVRKGEIVAVGKKLAAPGAQQLDGPGMIVLPGFIVTHWHMWNTPLRSISG